MTMLDETAGDAARQLRVDLAHAVAGPTHAVPDEKEPWRIESDAQAQWALSMLAEAEAEIAEVRAAAAEQQQRIAAWVDRRTATPRHSASFFTTELVRYLRTQRDETPEGAKKPKKVDLPAGVVKWSRSPKVEITDPDAFIAWCEANGYDDAVKRLGPPPPAPLVSGIKSHLQRDDDEGLLPMTMDGEVVPGIVIDPNEKYEVDAVRPLTA